jgi:hypothetical protein
MILWEIALKNSQESLPTELELLEHLVHIQADVLHLVTLGARAPS